MGKTWLMREFGRTCYDRTVYINFDNNPRMRELFAGDLDIGRLIGALELESGVSIQAGAALIVFDEVQEVPRALTSLKYFNENAPQYDIVAAGSLLGIALHPGTSFPVGKVEFLDLRPLSFAEFVKAQGEERLLVPLERGDFQNIPIFRERYESLLRSYYFVGGMPEAVSCFAETRDFGQVRAVQKRILGTYEEDFSKHAPPLVVPRLRLLWNSLPAQLARENRKFVYGIIKQGARARDYEIALLWLLDCGLVHRVNRVSTPRIPLPAYQDFNAFKLFAADTGLLACMAELKPEHLLEGAALFREFKGALTEQFVLQELKTIPDLNIYYWSADKGTAEVDFVLGGGLLSRGAVPLEVKAEINLQAKSLKSYRELFKPALALRSSLADYHETPGLVDIPLYGLRAWLNSPSNATFAAQVTQKSTSAAGS